MSEVKVENVSYKNILLTGVISLIVAVLGSWIVNKLTNAALGLVYETATSEVFSASSGSVQIATIRIKNNGTKAIEEVTAVIASEGSEIKEYKISGLSKDSYTSSLNKSEVNVSIKYLNPEEEFNIQFLLSGEKAQVFSPKIELRGKGVLGKSKETKNRSSVTLLFIPALFGIVMVYLLPIIRRKLFPHYGYTTKHKDDQRDVLAYILGNFGFIAEAKEIRLIERTISYWSLCDYLCEKWISTGDKEVCLKGARAMEQLIEYADIADTSVMLINTCIANLYKNASDNEKSAQAALNAFEVKHKVIEKRLHYSEIDLKNT
jgi:hypothetical protein